MRVQYILFQCILKYLRNNTTGKVDYLIFFTFNILMTGSGYSSQYIKTGNLFQIAFIRIICALLITAITWIVSLSASGIYDIRKSHITIFYAFE